MLRGFVLRGAGLPAVGDPEALVRDATGDDRWVLKVAKADVRIWSRSVPGSPNNEIRGNGLIEAPPRKVLELLRQPDAATIRQYNPMYDEGYDLERIDARTKISFGTARAIFPFKPRDTVTRIAEREVQGGTGGTVLLLRAVEHASMPPQKTHVRARIVRGMHLIQPVAGQPARTNFTFCQQVDVGGILPAWLMNQLIAQDSVEFVKRVGAASARRR